jgi:hypothetical protein
LENSTVAITIAAQTSEIQIYVRYIHPRQNKTGSLGVLPHSDGAIEAFRAEHGVKTEWLHVVDPATGLRLKAFRPVEGNMLSEIRDTLRIRDGQTCVATYKAVANHGRVEMRLASIRAV